MINNNYYYRYLLLLLVLISIIWLLVSPLNQAIAEYSFLKKWPDQPFDIGYIKGIAVDSGGNLYIADTHKHRIQKFSTEGDFLTKWGSFGSLEEMFYWPEGISVDSKGNVYVADTENNRIQKFNLKGKFLDVWGSAGSSDGQFNKPRGIAVDSSGFIYVSDTGNNRIQKFNLKGKFLDVWGSAGSSDGQFNEPRGIAVDTHGNIYVSDTKNRRIQKFNNNGEFLKKWGSNGSSESQFIFPEGLDVDSLDNVFVADRGNNRIQKFNSEGVFLDKWGNSGTGDGQFNQPTDVAVDSLGNVYVSEYMNKRIQKFVEGNKNTLPSGKEEVLKNDSDDNQNKKTLDKSSNNSITMETLTDKQNNNLNLKPQVYLPNITRYYFGWTTNIIIQNTSTEDAIVQAHFIDKNGKTVLVKTFKGLLPNSSLRINPSQENILGQSFQGSVVVYSDKQITAVVNEHAESTSMSYQGSRLDEVGKEVYLPNITCFQNGWYTTFIIQNLGEEDALISIEFYEEGKSSPILKETLPALSPRASIGINPLSRPTLQSFKGSVVIRGSQNLSAIVNEHFGNKQAMSYAGYSKGSNESYLPNIVSKKEIQATPLIVQNIQNQEIDFVIDFYDKTNNLPVATKKVSSLGPFSSIFINPDELLTEPFQGYAKVKSEKGKINTVANAHLSNDTYSFFGSCLGGIKNYLPNIAKEYFGWTSNIFIQNIDKEEANISIHIYDSKGIEKKLITTRVEPQGGVFNYNLKESSEIIGNRFIGSAVIESKNGQKINSIVCAENINGQEMSYNGYCEK